MYVPFLPVFPPWRLSIGIAWSGVLDFKECGSSGQGGARIFGAKLANVAPKTELVRYFFVFFANCQNRPVFAKKTSPPEIRRQGVF